MNAFVRAALRVLHSNEGHSATEYAVLIGLICVAAIGALSAFGVHMDNLYMAVANTMPGAGGS